MTVQDALRMYFAKIRSPQYFPMYPARYDPDAAKRVLAGQYLVPREKTPDFSAFEREFGIPLPEDLRAYYSTWHPYLTGGIPETRTSASVLCWKTACMQTPARYCARICAAARKITRISGLSPSAASPMYGSGCSLNAQQGRYLWNTAGMRTARTCANPRQRTAYGSSRLQSPLQS